MINKPIIVLDCFLDDVDKEKIFLQNLEQFKKLSTPILLITNSPMSREIQEKVNYLIYDKENILFKGEYFYDLSFFHVVESDKFSFIIDFWYKQEHGLSVLCNLTKTMNFAKKLGFTKFVHFEWDYFIHDADLTKIKQTIVDFVENNKMAFLVKNGKQISFHFWMIDIDYWQNEFPQILKEEDYKNYLKIIKKNNLFQKVEDIFYIVFERFFYTEDYLELNEFKNQFITESKLNLSVSDFNFAKPNTLNMYIGLAKIYKKNNMTDEIALVTINNKIDKIIETNYSIKINNDIKFFKHLTGKNDCSLSVIHDFDKSKFPIELKINNEFEKIYYSLDEITNSVKYKK